MSFEPGSCKGLGFRASGPNRVPVRVSVQGSIRVTTRGDYKGLARGHFLTAKGSLKGSS